MESNGAVHSGTGVFYQALPAVGVDGGNIMKLIPVQMINGQFVQSQISKYKTDGAKLQRPININLASAPIQMVNKATSQTAYEFVKKQFSLINGMPKQVGVTGRVFDADNSLSKYPPQAIKLVAKVHQRTSPMPNCGKWVTLPNQLPVTVKSPVLPSGQYLQIPPNAQIRTVPASELPPAIKKQIFTSSANSSTNSSSSTVLYVSPVTAMNQGIPRPSDSPIRSLKLLSKSSDQTSCGTASRGSKPHSKLITKDSQRPNSPIKWVIEEEDGPMATDLAPLNSPSMTSEILRAVAERENANKAFETIAKKTPVSQSSSAKSGKDSALVMCNGKVFFVAKKCNFAFKIGSGKTGSLTTTNSNGFKKTNILPSQQSNVSDASQSSYARHDSKQILIPDESDEVIDLCDDSQDDLSHQAIADTVSMPAITQLDEDNVIFVSYIPPKSVSRSRDYNIQKTQVNEKALEEECVKEDKQKGNKRSLDNIGQKMVSGWGCTAIPINESCRNISAVCDCQVSEESDIRKESCSGQEGEPSQSSTDKPCKTASSPEMENIQSGNGGLKMNSLHSSSTQQMEGMQVHMEMENNLHDYSTSDSSNRPSGVRIQIEKETHKIELQSSTDPSASWTSSVSYQKSSQSCDRLLRLIFGITSDVKIYLQKIDATKSVSVPKEVPQIESITEFSLVGIRELLQKSAPEKEQLKKKQQESQKRNSSSCPTDAKRVELQTDQELSVDRNTADKLIIPNLQMDVGPLSCPNTKLNTKPLTTLSPQTKNNFNSSQSPDKEMCDVEFEPMFGYVEPIDEDFISSTDENGIPNSQDTVANPQTNTSFMDCLPEVFCVDLNTNPRRRVRVRKRRVCPCCISGTPIKDSVNNSSTNLEEADLAKQKRYVTTELGNKMKKLGLITEQSGKKRKKDKNVSKEG
ncbi:uncharacterized protein lrif1 isoform X2 [Centroberyx affinis]|uniref:uncharacterized protein lrif1 isoform X2 n=1 Tax=Centroberyx affinis TaxID=166261 RepID=UPI003A5C2B3E